MRHRFGTVNPNHPAMLQKQLLFAIRRIGRHKLNTTINILGLTLGVLACLVIYLFVSFEFSYDKGHPDGDRIYRVVRHLVNADGKVGKGSGLTPPLATDLRRELPNFGTVANVYIIDSRVIVPHAGSNPGATTNAPRVFSELRPGEPHHIAFVEPNFTRIFPRKWLAGNPGTALNDPFSVVLTKNEAGRYFGGDNPQEWMGRTLVYNDSLTVSVTGIVDDWAQNSDLRFTDLLSYTTIATSFLQKDMNGWNMWETAAQGYVTLAPNVTKAQAEAQFPAFVARHNQLPKDMKAELHLQPLADIHFNGEYNDNYGRRAHKPTLYALIGIALFILLIASINFINLSTAQAVQRAREIGVRKVLGSSRLGLTTQFLTETSLIVVAAMTLALLVANPVIRALQGFIPQGVSLQLGNPLTLGFIGLTMILTCLLAGWYPARVLSAFLPVISLRGQGTQQLNSRSYLRKGLIVFQFTVSLLFIIGTLIVGRQMHYVLNNDLGFDKDAILTVQLPDLPRSKAVFLTTEFSRMPGVQLASLASGSPAGSGHPGTVLQYKGQADVKIEAGCDIIDANYVRIYGLSLLAGRNLFAADSAGAYMINESASRGLGFQHPADALGKVLTSGFGGFTGPIVGVLRDFHAESYHEAIKPFFYVAKKDWSNLISLKLTAAKHTPETAKILIGRLEHTFRIVCPDANFNARFFDEAIAQLYAREQNTAQIINIAMAIAIFISCMGLFGLAAYTASQRTREIGIRKVLGASVPHLVSLLSRDFVVLVLLSTLIAAPIAAWGMHQWLQDFVYRTSVPWWIYATAGLGAIAIALITVSFQAIRAATANPVEALKSE
ncbi:MAG TPA: FtsX-like permease family protein [Puia sp.]